MARYFIMRSLLICFLFVSLYDTAAFAQSPPWKTEPQSWWVDKPVVSADCVAILKHGYTRICIYLVDLSTDYADHHHDTTYWGAWTLNAGDGKIISSTWKWDSAQIRKHGEFYPVTRSSMRKHEIKQTLKVPGSGFRYAHHLDSTGNVAYTSKLKSMGKFFESRYFFDRIDYRYKEGLLNEARYYNYWMFEDRTFVYSKLLFKYE